uniref:Zgc:64106 n=1 Tax=Hucho hucho TaxID=62062 RepID=A0A4W5NVQ0_9TELE
MSWVWTDVFSHPLWAVSTVIFGLLFRSQQRGSWDTRACLVQLKGKTTIVTGANTGLPGDITSDGLEVSFATNHVGPFLLTNLLLDLLKRSAPARIVNVSSVNHWRGVVDFSHFKGENLAYTMDSVYNHTKLHNIICTNELARRLQGTGVTANSLHPGVVMTEVMRHYNFLVRFLFNLIGIFFFKVNTLYHDQANFLVLRALLNLYH